MLRRVLLILLAAALALAFRRSPAAPYRSSSLPVVLHHLKQQRRASLPADGLFAESRRLKISYSLVV